MTETTNPIQESHLADQLMPSLPTHSALPSTSVLKTSMPMPTEINFGLFSSKVESIRPTTLAMHTIANSTEVQQSSKMEKTGSLNPTLLPTLQYRPISTLNVGIIVSIAVGVGVGFALLGVALCVVVFLKIRRKHHERKAGELAYVFTSMVTSSLNSISSSNYFGKSAN